MLSSWLLSRRSKVFALAIAIACIALSIILVPSTADAASNNLTSGTIATHAKGKKAAGAVVKDGFYKVTSQASGKPLQVAGGNIEKGSNVQQSAKGTSLERIFKFTYDESSGYYRILSPASGLVLDVAGGENADGVNVQVYSSNNSRAQLWAAVKNADGTYTFRSALGGRVLDIEGASHAVGANLQLYTSNGTEAQKWKLKAVKQWLPNGTYTFASSRNTNSMMSVARESKAPGANVKTSSRNHSNAQKWTVRWIKAAGAYLIYNRNSKHVLTARNATAGANVVQAKGTGKANQLWIPQALNGGIRFVSAANPKVAFGVVAGSRVAGANIAVCGGKAKTYARFRLRDASLPSFKVYINPGHGWNSNGNGAWDPGASGSGYDEADFTHDLSQRVKAYCESYGIEVVNGAQYALPFWERLPKAVSLKCNAIVSIHFDWSGAGRSGTHTMVGVQGKAPGSDLLDRIIHRHLVEATGLPDLGTFERSDITAVNGPIPSTLMEVCFMDNASDVDTYLNRRDAIAKAIADGILEASRQPELN